MSFSALASFSDNKDPGTFGQSCEHLGVDFFDQLLTFDPIDFEGHDYPALPESPHLAKSVQKNDLGGSSPSLRNIEGDDSTTQEAGWNWAFGQKAASSHHSSALGSQFYSELSGRGAISDGELLSLENISLGSPVSPLSPQPRANSLPTSTPPATTAPRRKASSSGSIPKGFKKAVSFDKSLRTPIRKTPKMLRVSESFRNSLDIWGNKLTSKFYLDFEHPVVPLSPPHSVRVSDASEASSSTKITRESNDDALAYSNGISQHFNGRPTEYDTPLATPLLDSGHSRKTSDQQPFTDHMNFPQTPQFHQGSGSWSQIPESSNLPTYGTPAIHTPDIDAPMWWNHAATAPMAQPSPTALHSNPRRTTRSFANQLQTDLSYDTNGLSCSLASQMPTGLMIQIPESGAQSFVITSPDMQSPHMSQQGYFGHPQPQPSSHQYLPPPRPYIPGAAEYPQYSSPMRTHQPSHPHSESPSPKTKSASFHVRKSRKTKGSKHTPRTPSTAAADFVNFTPNDSRKILTGVAPSGSSKTKARREKEAMEKRRKLSMAALRAVRAAGGDVESLVEQGLLL